MSFCGHCFGCTFRLPRNVGKHCKHGSNCERVDCYYAHASPAGSKNMAGQKTAACELGIRCTRGNCAFAHPSPSLKCSNYHGYSDCSDSDSEYECNECGRTFGDGRALEQHQETTGHDNRSDEYECFCKVCGRTFRDWRALEQHQGATGHDNLSDSHKYECKCGRTFRDGRALEQHLEATRHDNGSDEYECCECKECWRTFRDGRALEQHQEATGHDNRCSQPRGRRKDDYRLLQISEGLARLEGDIRNLNSARGRGSQSPPRRSYSSSDVRVSYPAQLADFRGLPPVPSSTSVAQSLSNCPESVSSLHSFLSCSSEVLRFRGVLFLTMRFRLFISLAEDTTTAQEERLSEEKPWLKAVEKGGTSLNSSRLCLVGQGRAGKTALANALINKEFKQTDSTIGVSQRFLEVDKVDLAAGDGGQWNVLGEDKRFMMSPEEALARQAAQFKLLEESTISVPEERQMEGQGTENIADLLTGEERDEDDDSSRELERASREGGRDVSAQDAIETINTLDSKPSFGAYSSPAAVGGIHRDLSASFQSESPGKTRQKKDFSSSKEKVIKRMNMELPDMRAGRKEPLRISLWDYGGQDKFIGMHHLYVSRYCVYLLVFNMKWLLPDACENGECLEYLTAWLNSISVHAVDRKDKSQAPILIIGTHKDEVPNPEDHASISKILEDKFAYHRAWASVQQFQKARGKEGRGIRLSFFPVDNTRGHQDDVLKQMQSEVLKVVKREKYVNRKVNYTWLEAYEALQKESKTKIFVEFEKVKDICSEIGMGTDLELNVETVKMLKFFHQMGLIMYHDEKALKHLVVLDPARFLVEPASRVLCQHDIDESASFAPTEERIVLMRTLKSRKPHQYEDLRKGILYREILREFLWSDVADNRDELELLMTKYQLMVPLTNEDGNEDRFLVPGLLPEQQTNQVDDHPDKPPPRLVGYFIFGHKEIILKYRKRGEGYVSVDNVKEMGFLPKGLFAAVLGSIVAECELVHDMSFSDMEMTLSSISTGFGSHKFVLRQLPEYNMMELVLMVDSPLLVVERLLEGMQRAVSKLMPNLRFAICIDQEGGVCHDGQMKTLTGTDYLVILDGDGNILDGRNSLEQRLSAAEDIKVAPHKILPKIDARNKFGKWLIPKELRKDYQVFLSYREGDFDTELVKALFSNLCTAVSEQGRQVHVFLDKYCLQEGRRISSDFAKALKNSLVVVPVVSYAALLRMFDLKPDSDIDNVLLEWMLIVELLERGHLKFWYPIMAGEVKEDAENGKFILDLDGCIDKLPEVVCTQVARRVNELLVNELGMEPSESVHTYTIRGVVKKITSDIRGFSAWEMNALPMKQQQSKLHVQMDWKKGLYKLAAGKVLKCVENATQAKQKEEEEAAAARAREEEAARMERAGVAESPNSATSRNLPRIEGFFCKINPDKERFRRTIESVRNAGASDKDVKLKELEALWCKIESIDPHKEAQELQLLLQKSNRRREFEVSFHAQPTFKIFSDCMLTAAERNVSHLHFSGHGHSQCGFFWLKEGALEYEKIPTEKFVSLFTTEVACAHSRGTIECVVLNACNTEGLGKKLRNAGVPHVVCWRSEVFDSTASQFTIDFYRSYEENKDLKISFRRAASRIGSGRAEASLHKKHLHLDAVDYVCLLSKDGDEFLDTGHIRGRVEDGGGDTQTLSVEIDDDAQGGLQGSDDDGNIVRNWRPPKYLTDYGALAGQAERECLELLGFQMTLPGDESPICAGKGIEPNGFIKDSRVFAMWGVKNYTSDVWGSTKKAVQEAKKLLSSPAGKSKVSQAIEKLRDVEDYRKKDMEKHGGACGAHAHPLKEIEATRKGLEDLTSPLNSLSALSHVLPAVAATRSAPERRTQPPPPSTPSTRAPTALDEADDGECKTDVSLSSSRRFGCWQARKDSKKIDLPDKAGERLTVKKNAAFKKKMAKQQKRRDAAAAQAALQGPITKEGSLAEVSLQAEATPAAASTVVLKSKKKRNKALKALLGPLKEGFKISAKISKISKDQRAQKRTAFKLKLQASRALAAAAESIT